MQVDQTTRKILPWRPRVVETAQQLIELFLSYRLFIEKSPLEEDAIFIHAGEIVRVARMRARPLTLSGFCSFLHIAPQTWRYWRKNRPDLSRAIEMIEDVIYVQKFEGAAAGIFKANIISRDLGAAHRSR